MLSSLYDKTLRNISLDLSEQSRYNLNHGTFSNTMAQAEDLDEDLQFNFALIEVFGFLLTMSTFS